MMISLVPDDVRPVRVLFGFVADEWAERHDLPTGFAGILHHPLDQGPGHGPASRAFGHGSIIGYAELRSRIGYDQLHMRPGGAGDIASLSNKLFIFDLHGDRPFSSIALLIEKLAASEDVVGGALYTASFMK